MNGKPLCYAVLGARGSGKTAWCVQEIGRLAPDRLAVWDFKHDRVIGNGIAFSHTVSDPAAMARAMRAPRFRVRYLVDHKRDIPKQFDWFCEVCWTASRLLMYVAELPMVTTASRPPAPWRQCVNVGRDYRAPDGKDGWLAIMADGQRESEIDKAFISNADVVNAGRQAWPIDAKAAALRLGGGVTQDEILQMPDLHRIERRAGEPVKRFVLTFKGNTAKKKPAAKAAASRSLRDSS